MKKAKEYPVRIVTRTHPHAGELGVIRADDDGKTEVMTMGKLKLFKVWLTNCPWGREPARKGCGELDSWLNTVLSGLRSCLNLASKPFTAALLCAVVVW